MPPSLLSPAPLLRSLCATAALALAAAPALAHPVPMGAGAHQAASTLTVQGEGQASVAPDTAAISLGVTTQAPTAAQAMADNAARQSAVIEALKGHGIEPRDIQTAGLNLSPMQDYSREGQPPVITGYQAQNMVMIRVRDIARLGGVLDGLVAAGANEVQGISFSREDATATEDEARRDAVENARHRAGVLAEAAGMKLGRMLSLADSRPQSGPVPVMMAMAREADAKSTPIEAGELNVTAQVFEMLPSGGPDAAPACPMMPGGPMMHHGPGHHPMMHHGPEGGPMHSHTGMMPGGMGAGGMPEASGAPAPSGSGAAPARTPQAPQESSAAESGPAGVEGSASSSGTSPSGTGDGGGAAAQPN
ncbi:MAG TPA: SIMPL domain-containing protein [Paracoccus sp. (in: a-proteobacteria)]|nr:SIMPL domain-containing protein [Paracoccus sp. (in: a-proteobacteria)]